MTDELDCPHRSQEIHAKLNCGCGGWANGYRCDHPAVNGLVTRHAVQLRSKVVKLKIPGPDGSRALRLDGFKLPACILCPHRPGAAPGLRQNALAGEPAQNPNEPASAREPCLQAAIEAICGACPRLNPAGQTFGCPGATAPRCPLDLWPDLARAAQQAAASHRRGGCRNCG